MLVLLNKYGYARSGIHHDKSVSPPWTYSLLLWTIVLWLPQPVRHKERLNCVIKWVMSLFTYIPLICCILLCKPSALVYSLLGASVPARDRRHYYPSKTAPRTINLVSRLVNFYWLWYKQVVIQYYCPQSGHCTALVTVPVSCCPCSSCQLLSM